MSRTSRQSSLPIVAVLAAAIGVMLTAIVSAVPAEARDHSLSEEVVKMLEVGLAEEVVLEWLEGRTPPSKPLSADDLVALKEAGASTDFLKVLIEWTRGSRAIEPVAPAPTSGVMGSVSGGLPVTFKLSYLARFEAPDPTWDLYVYLDGQPLAYLTTASIENRAETRELVRSLPSGRHVLRVAQERHNKWRGRWEHESRGAVEAFPFDLVAGSPARVELEFTQSIMGLKDPLIFKLIQGSEVLDSGRVGGEPELWPLLCEDIEASVPEGKQPGREKRRRLEQCVRWDQLWGSDLPSRQEVLDAMAGFDFRPIPKGS